MEKKIDLTQFRENFIREAKERIARMNSALVYLEKNPGDLRLEADLLREAHTLKGAAKMMGYAKISDLSHRFEEALSRRKERKIVSNRDLTDALFVSLDTLSVLVDALSQSGRPPIDVDGVFERLRLAQVPVESAASPPTPVPGAPLQGSPQENEPGAERVDAPVIGIDAGRGIRVEPERLEQMANLLTEAIGSHLRQVELRDLIGEMGRKYRWVALNLLSNVRDGIEQGIIPAEFSARIAPILEEGKEVFVEIGSRLSELRRQELQESSVLSQTLEDIRSENLAIRMVPLLPLFESFHRSVRELSRGLGKDVELLVRGGKTEIDRKVAEALTDPLIHLIRNAIDHGIEAPEARAACGKPARGKIKVTATPKKGRVVIEVEDDGKGIDLQEVRETAVKKGMIAEKTAYRLDDQELISLIFRSGFSTAKAMSEISGRGIGMDIVRETAEKFNGTVEVFTLPGKGTRVVLELPFTMAVSRVLLFRVENQHFGIPIMHSEGVVRFSGRDIVTVEGRKTVRIDDSPVPLVWLSHLLEIGTPDLRQSRYLAVMVRHSQRRIALVVDEVKGEFEFIVKDLGTYLKKVPLFMGSSIMGTGDIALLLDVYDLVSAIRLRPEAAPEGKAAAGIAGDVLVVDDSLLSREMQRRVIASAGCRVETAPEGKAALELLSRKTFDLVVAAVRMSGMDGLELVGHIRAKDMGRNLPVVLVATRENPADRERAMLSGAQECVLKEDFDVERITPLIGRLLAGSVK
ncbi:MAG: hybrid sensor histidine kinase/response regulator [Deltaproteobacteria bacterium]|nr:hybrid sensor histidine kinase/response regulator [Deltaproteobacteria bacterium]